MQAVLISINPKWCELIASDKKTVEVRKTRPKLETPFKVYIYCTVGKSEKDILQFACFDSCKYMGRYVANGKVIGEFVCDKVENIEIRHFTVFGHENRYTAVGEKPDYQWLQKSCLSYDEVVQYGQLAPLYGWHISDLEIYDKPRELSEFKTFCEDFYDGNHCAECKYFIDGRGYEYDESDCGCNGLKPIARPPQSWMYVEV